jgi:hypothetical protein
VSIPILAALLSLAAPHMDTPTPATTTTTTTAVTMPNAPTAYVWPTTTTTTTTPPTSSAWWRVARCEEGGNNDPTYGYFGIHVASWSAYGGQQYAPTAGGATYWQQVDIAERIDGAYVPDANGCASW